MQPQELQDLLDRELRLIVDIVHGPLLTRGGVGVGLADALVRPDPATQGLDELLATLNAQGAGEGMARIGVASVSPFRWVIPPITIANPDNDSTFSSSALVSDGVHDFNRQHLVIRNRMDSLRMSGQSGAFEMEDLTISGDMTAIARGIWTGTSEVGIGSLLFAGREDSPIAALDNLNIRSLSAATEGGDRIDVHIEVNADSVEGIVDGDAQRVGDVDLSVALRNVDMAAALQYQEVFFDLAETEVPATDPTGLLAELEPIIHDFLEAELELEYGPLRFNWNDDTLQARVLLRIDNEMLPAEPAFSLTDTALWPRLVNVEAALDVDRNFAEWIAMRAMARQGGSPTYIPTDVPADILQAQGSRDARYAGRPGHAGRDRKRIPVSWFLREWRGGGERPGDPDRPGGAGRILSYGAVSLRSVGRSKGNVSSATRESSSPVLRKASRS